MTILSIKEVHQLESELLTISMSGLDTMRDRLKQIYDTLENSYHSNRNFELKVINGGVK
jgi:hypothetical protein